VTSRKSDYSPMAWERHKARERARYRLNHQQSEWVRRENARIRAHSIRRTAVLETLKRERGCIDCGRKDGRLDFDHRPGQVKLFNIGPDVNRSWAVLMAEIAKCDVRCASCHARRHDLERAQLVALGVRASYTDALA
jgi:hypothetical protein